MPSPTGIRIVIALFAGFILAIAALTGDSIDQNALRWASGAASGVILLVLVYDRWVWRWPLVSRIAEWTNRPVLHGTWKGTLEFERDAAGQPGAIDFYMTIHQTYSTIEVDGHVSTSSSHSTSAGLERPRRGQRLLWFIYQSEAPIPDQAHNQPHYGAAKLTLVGSPVIEISGSYWPRGAAPERCASQTTRARRTTRSRARRPRCTERVVRLRGRGTTGIAACAGGAPALQPLATDDRLCIRIRSTRAARHAR